MSKEYDDNNTFILFVNDKGDNPKRPDRTGKMTFEGVEYKLSGWIATDENGNPKKDKAGNPMLRGKVSPVEDAAPKHSSNKPAQRQAEPAFEDDDIPF